MDPVLRAALLLNAARAPLEIFERLCDDYDPDALDRGENFWKELGLRPTAQKILSGLLLEHEWPERELERLESCGAHFLTTKDLDYPSRLRELKHPPVGLYVRGRLNLAIPSVAVVGTRRCSSYGKSVAESLGRALGRSGFSVVSGGARGIDAAGHRGCLAGGASTIAVFGTGIDRAYPSEHRDLFEQIMKDGALVSEYPMGTGGDPWRFPERNRIIVGMTARTIVVESPEDGGAMITARLAMDLGREVWCVPGRITETVCRGTNLLIHDGAHVLFDIDDFMQCVTGQYGKQLSLGLDALAPGESKPVRPVPELPPEGKIILSLLQRQGSRMIDDLIAESGLDFATVNDVLMDLETEGLIMSSSGRYSASA